MNLDNNEQEIPEEQREEYELKLSAKDLACRRQKQNHKEENLLAPHRESFPLKEGIGSILNQENLLFLRKRFRRK